MIRCFLSQPSHLIKRYPCPVHQSGKRNKQLALAVVQRDRACWKCGATTNLDAGHIVPRAWGGQDTMANMRAECASLNRGGECKG